ncbi:alpha/beta fold hydrolase [Streptomyces sp. NPDC005955]|uniref:alpha/beta fold hydrolase n=1 Tax=Streptomyces sp. NPDC005955 TaxID=3364738 RepID=UPI0036967044
MSGDPAPGVTEAVTDVVAGAVTGAVSAGNWRRGAGIAGIAIGVVAAAAATGVAVERLTVSRSVRRKARTALDAAGPYGELRGTSGTAVADDGTALSYEVEEPGDFGGTGGPGQGPGAGRRGPFRRRATAPTTVVFSHGYCLNQDAWHFQRAALRGLVRTVYWDQRGHGRSARGPVASAAGEPVSIDRLGRDLLAVIEAAAPEGPLVLVGHSMGGMTVMAFAAEFPELVRERVTGIAFVGTSAGRLAEVSFGLPAVGVNAVRRVLPGVLRVLGPRAELVERGRRATADLFAGVVKRYSFASRDVDPAVARFAERMIEATPFEVVADFYPAFAEHDKSEALAGLDGLPVLVLAGEQDLITPAAHSEAVAERLDGAELVLVPDAGHLVMLEHPGTVTDRIAALLVRAGALPAGTTVNGYGTERAPSRTAGDDG